MKKIKSENWVTSILVCLLFLFSYQIQAQNLTKTNQTENYDTYKVDSEDVYGNILNADIPRTAALRKYIIQEIKKNNDVLDIKYSKEAGFFIDAVKNVEAISLDQVIVTSINTINTTLNSLIDNGTVDDQLSNYIKSSLLEY